MTTYYIIKDAKTGALWSRNHWGTAKSSPDLYLTHANAMRQVKHGKIAIHDRYWPGEYKPVVVAVELTELSPV